MTSEPTASGRRLAPEARRRQLLDAGLRCLARDSLMGFSMEAVAREANVTGALPRHYFKTREGMLMALYEDLLSAVRHTFAVTGRPVTLEERLNKHLDFIEQYPWSHNLWLHASEFDPEVTPIKTRARRELVIASGFGTDWNSMTRAQQLAGLGWIGYVESVLQEWISGGCRDRDAALQVLLTSAKRLTTAPATSS